VEFPLRIWVIGDSLAGPVGWGIEALGAGTADTIIENHGGSGLVRDDVFDWPADAPALLEASAPDVVVVILGANDGQSILDAGGSLAFGTEAWLDAYRSRVEAFVAQLAAGSKAVYWVGVPIMEAASYRARMEVLNDLLAVVARDHDELEFIDIWDVLAGPDGAYRSHLPAADGGEIAVRAPDGIHYTQAGADLVAARVFAAIAEDWGLGG